MINFFKILPLLILFLRIDCISQSAPSEHKVENVKIGFSIQLFDEVDISDATVAIKLFGDELTKGVKDKYSPLMKIYKNNAEIINDFNKDSLDIISVLTLDYFKLFQEIEIFPGLTTGINETPGHEYLVLVRKENNFKSLLDLKGKKILLPLNNYGRLGKIWLETSLANLGVKNFETFFGKIKYAEKPTQAVLPVFFKGFDACIVPKSYFETMCELNPQLKTELKVLAKSPHLVNALICLRKDLKDEIQNVFRDISLRLSKHTSGQQLLSLFGAKQLVLFQPSLFEETEKLYKQYQSLKK